MLSLPDFLIMPLSDPEIKPGGEGGLVPGASDRPGPTGVGLELPTWEPHAEERLKWELDTAWEHGAQGD